MHINKWLTDEPPEDLKLEIYEKCLAALKKPVKGAGRLITNHFMGIISSLGLLATWIRSYALVPHNSKYMIYFKKHFSWETLTDKI